MTTTTIDTTVCPAWCSGIHDSIDNDGGNVHASTSWELHTGQRGQCITVGVDQSTADAAAGRTPQIRVYINDEQQTPPALIGVDLYPHQALQLARMLRVEATAAL